MNVGTLIFFMFGIIFLMMVGIVAAIAIFYKKPGMGQAIIRSGLGGVKIAYEKGVYVVPLIHKMEIMNLSMTVIDTEFMHENSLICKDNTRADVKINFLIQPSRKDTDLFIAANTIGCKRSFDKEALKEIYGSKFSETVKTLAKDLTFEDMLDFDNFKLQILQNSDIILNGYILYDCIIDYLEKSTYKNADSVSV